MKLYLTVMLLLPLLDLFDRTGVRVGPCDEMPREKAWFLHGVLIDDRDREHPFVRIKLPIRTYGVSGIRRLGWREHYLMWIGGPGDHVRFGVHPPLDPERYWA